MEISKEDLQKLLREVVAGAVAEARRMNPLEQRKYDEDLKREQRRREMMVELGRIEDAARARRKYGCSHQRYPASAGKLAGHPCPNGQGEWTTGGQPHTGGLISLICTRCSTIWVWRATGEEYQFAVDTGMAGMAPPMESRCLSECCPWCNKMFTKDELKEHDPSKCHSRRQAAIKASETVVA